MEYIQSGSDYLRDFDTQTLQWLCWGVFGLGGLSKLFAASTMKKQFPTLPLFAIPLIGIWELVALYLLHESKPWGVTMLQVFMGGVVCAVIVMKGPKTGNLAAGKTMLEAMGPASIIMPIFGFVLVFAYHLQIGSGPGLDLVPFTTAGFVIAFIISTMIE